MTDSSCKLLSDYSLAQVNLAELEHIKASVADCRAYFEGHVQELDAEIAVIEAEIRRRRGGDDAEQAVPTGPKI